MSKSYTSPDGKLKVTVSLPIDSDEEQVLANLVAGLPSVRKQLADIGTQRDALLAQPDQWAGDCTQLFAALPGVAAFLKASNTPNEGASPYSRPVYGI
jgi:hypothetical protein